MGKFTDKNNSIWVFNPAQYSQEFFLNSVIGREEILSGILKWIRSGKGSTQKKHRLFYGTRGIGKTTLLLSIFHSILKQKKIRKSLIPVIFTDSSKYINNEVNFVKFVYDFLNQNKKSFGIEEEFDDHVWEPELQSLFKFSQSVSRTLIFLIDNFQEFLSSLLEGRGGKKLASRVPDFIKSLFENPDLLDPLVGRRINRQTLGSWSQNRLQKDDLVGIIFDLQLDTCDPRVAHTHHWDIKDTIL